MENFIAIYKILSFLEKNLDYTSFDEKNILPEVLGITKERRDALLVKLMKNGYMEGMEAIYYIDEGPIIVFSRPSITLAGLEYLAENKFMRRASKICDKTVTIVSCRN